MLIIVFFQIIRVDELPWWCGDLIRYVFLTIIMVSLMAVVFLAGILIMWGIGSDPDYSIRIWVQLEGGDGEVWVAKIYQRGVIGSNDCSGPCRRNHWHMFRGSAAIMQIFCDFALFQC